MTESVHSDHISVIHPMDEQNSHISNQEDGNPKQNHFRSQRSGRIIPMKKTAPMIPTPLEFSYWSTHPTEIAVSAFATFTGVVIIVGVFIVYLTTGSPMQKCDLNFQRTLKNPIEYKADLRSVAIGYFNNDTWLDMVVADNIANQITIYLGNSNGTFSREHSYFTDSNSAPNMVSVGDFNNDYKSDIAVANFDTHDISIFFGLGNGSFARQEDLRTGSSRPKAIYLVDLNHDTFLDVIVVNHGTESVSVFCGHGNGTFSDPEFHSTGYDSSPSSLIAGHFNSDEHLDIAIANTGTNTVGIFLGNGSCIFTDQVTFLTGSDSRPSSITCGHFNNDTFLDIAVANSGTNKIGIFLNNGDMTFAYQTTAPIDTTSLYSVDVGDFNRDKKLDLVVVNKGINNTGVILGYGNGSFMDAKLYSTGSVSSISLAVGDLNRDDRLDLVITNNDTGSIDILHGYFEGFSKPMRFSFGCVTPSGTTAAAAAGDFNNDGRLDIIVGCPYNDTVSVLFGFGNGSFANPKNYAAGSWLLSVAVGDVNNDTYLDIIVSNDKSRVNVLLGRGDGSFASRIESLTGCYQELVVVGDVNNDSHLDMVVSCDRIDKVNIIYGYGNGTFTNLKHYTASFELLYAALGDFNNDSRMDIVAAGYSGYSFTVFLQSHDDFLANATMHLECSGLSAVAVGNLNYDCYLDIVVACPILETVIVLYGHGNGSFTNPMMYLAGPSPQSLAVGDINNDNRTDILVGNDFSNTVAVLLQSDNGSFSDPLIYPTSVHPRFVILGDFNNDTRLDVIVVQSYREDLDILLQLADGALRNDMTYALNAGSHLQFMTAGDINNDTQLDLIVANYGTSNIGVLFAYGNGSLMNPMILDTGLNSHPAVITIADFNDDNQLDIAVSNDNTKNIDILLGNGQKAFVRQTNNEFGPHFTPVFIAHGDFDNDRRSEIVVAYDDRDEIEILVMFDTGSFTNPTIYSSPFILDKVVGDLNNDGRPDIVLIYATYNCISVRFGCDDGSFVNETILGTGRRPSCVAGGDFNNDSNLDIVVANSGSFYASVFLGYGNGSFSNSISIAIRFFSMYVAAADFNHDGHLDVVFTVSADYSINIFLGYGNGYFADPVKYSTGTGSYAIVVGDFNNDNRSDIVVANEGSDRVTILLQSSNGSFVNRGNYSTGRQPSFVTFGDLNKDGQMDIVIANYFDHSVSVLLGYGNGIFKSQMTFKTGCRPWFASVNDFNNDSRLDILVVCGLNERLRMVVYGYRNEVFIRRLKLTTGSGSQPRSFIIADFNNDKHMDIAVANSGDDTIGIFLGHGNISFTSQVKYSTGENSTPLSIAAADCNNDKRLDIVVANFGTNNVGIFLGDDNGAFLNQTTYPGASSPRYVAVGDFDNDFISDIVIANYGNNKVLLLCGYKDGAFTKILSVPLQYNSQPFSVLAGDFNNDRKQDFAVANSGSDSLYIFLQTC